MQPFSMVQGLALTGIAVTAGTAIWEAGSANSEAVSNRAASWDDYAAANETYRNWNLGAGGLAALGIAGLVTGRLRGATAGRTSTLAGAAALTAAAGSGVIMTHLSGAKIDDALRKDMAADLGLPRGEANKLADAIEESGAATGGRSTKRWYDELGTAIAGFGVEESANELFTRADVNRDGAVDATDERLAAEPGRAGNATRSIIRLSREAAGGKDGVTRPQELTRWVSSFDASSRDKRIAGPGSKTLNKAAGDGLEKQAPRR